MFGVERNTGQRRHQLDSSESLLQGRPFARRQNSPADAVPSVAARHEEGTNARGVSGGIEDRPATDGPLVTSIERPTPAPPTATHNCPVIVSDVVGAIGD